MGTRTVSVDLQLRAAGFVAGAAEAEKATSSLNHELADVGDHGKDFAEAQADADKLTVAMKETSREVDKTGTQMKETAFDARFLADELAKTRREALELAAAFTITGNRADLVASKRKTRYASDLERLATSNGLDAKGLVGDASKLGSEAGQSFSAAFADAGPLEAIGGLLANPITGVPLIAAAALIGAEVGGVLGGAIVAGIGDAGIAAGVVAAFRDPRVKAAGQEVKTELGSIMTEVGAEFAGPSIAGLHLLRDEVAKLRPGLAAAAAELAPLTTDLFGGLAQGADKFFPHLERALVNAKPLIEWTANEIPKVADEVGGLFEELSKHADEERFALNALFGVMKMGIGTVEAFAKAGALILDVPMKLNEAASHLPLVGVEFQRTEGHVGDLGAALGQFGHTVHQQTTPSLQELEQQLHTTELSASSLEEEMSLKLLNTMLEMDHATLQVAESHTQLSQAIKENGRQTDINTAKGQANREAVLSSVEANVQQYRAMIDAGAGADEAARAYEANTQALERQLKKAGFTKQQIDDLIGSYKAVPGPIERDIAINGLAKAINDMNNLIRQLNGLKPLYETTIVTRHVSTGATRGTTGAYAEGGHWDRAAAVGMFLPPSDPGTVLAGEMRTGGEWLIPQAGISQQRAYGLLASAAAPHGYAVGRPAAMGGGYGGPNTLQLAATFVLPSGEVVHKQLITYAMNTGRQPAQLFPAASR
jgi:hypothetical protein